MNPYSLIIIIITLVLCALQLRMKQQLVFPGKKTVVENTALGISLVMVASFALFYGKSWEDYLAVGLVGVLMLLSYRKVGVAKNGIYSMNKVVMPLRWPDVRFLKVVKKNNGEELEIRSVGKRMTSNVITLPMAQFDEVVKFIGTKLKPELWEISDEKIARSIKEIRNESQKPDAKPNRKVKRK